LLSVWFGNACGEAGQRHRGDDPRIDAARLSDPAGLFAVEPSQPGGDGRLRRCETASIDYIAEWRLVMRGDCFHPGVKGFAGDRRHP
jgi:hypothetical protein